MRRLCGIAACLTLIFAAGCSAPKSYVAPIDIRLQDPPPGTAVVYLVRAPYDAAHIAVFSPSAKLVVMPPETYTVLVLAPGKHLLVTRNAAVFGTESELAPPYELQVVADERRFLSLSGLTSDGLVFTGAVISGIPLFARQQGTKSGSLAWKEVTEFDAQGLMSIAKPVLPEKGAL